MPSCEFVRVHEEVRMECSGGIAHPALYLLLVTIHLLLIRADERSHWKFILSLQKLTALLTLVYSILQRLTKYWLSRLHVGTLICPYSSYHGLFRTL